MSETENRLPPFTVAFDGGRTLACPTAPQPCEWIAVIADGAEIHHTRASALQANPGRELTRLAEALIPGLPETPGLPQPEEPKEVTWHECATTVSETANTMRFDAPPESIESVRICAPNGAVIGYWEDEFERDAAGTLAEILHVLTDNQRSDAPGEDRPIFTVALVNGRTLACPAYPEDCDWIAVDLEGERVHRSSAAAIARSPFGELTRLADALIPTRRHDPTLPQPADQEPADWRECAVATVDHGWTIRFDATPDEAERIRICSPSGHEIGYWVSTEFEEDPADCLGAAIGALAGGER